MKTRRIAKKLAKRYGFFHYRDYRSFIERRVIIFKEVTNLLTKDVPKVRRIMERHGVACYPVAIQDILSTDSFTFSAVPFNEFERSVQVPFQLLGAGINVSIIMMKSRQPSGGQINEHTNT